MIVLVLSSKRGSTPSPLVWTFAPFSAATTASAAVSFLVRAALALSPLLVTVKENVARSGTVSTEPFPVTVIVWLAVAADRANCGCATPATAAAAKSTRTAIAIFMTVIRRRGAGCHTAWRITRYGGRPRRARDRKSVV